MKTTDIPENNQAGPAVGGPRFSEGLGMSPERSLVVPVTEVRQYSEYGKFAVGDYVTRDGSDVQLVKDLTDDGFCGTFVCVVAPSSGWCAVGEEECNLCRRYTRVDFKPNDQVKPGRSASA
jgi:hypothetical protein